MTKPKLLAARNILLLSASTVMLGACNSSSTEEQISWINSWDSFARYEQKMEVLNTCFKQAGVRNLMDQMSDKQTQVYNACELAAISQIAESEGIYLEQELLQANIVQL